MGTTLCAGFLNVMGNFFKKKKSIKKLYPNIVKQLIEKEKIENTTKQFIINHPTDLDLTKDLYPVSGLVNGISFNLLPKEEISEYTNLHKKLTLIRKDVHAMFIIGDNFNILDKSYIDAFIWKKEIGILIFTKEMVDMLNEDFDYIQDIHDIEKIYHLQKFEEIKKGIYMLVVPIYQPVSLRITNEIAFELVNFKTLKPFKTNSSDLGDDNKNVNDMGVYLKLMQVLKTLNLTGDEDKSPLCFAKTQRGNVPKILFNRIGINVDLNFKDDSLNYFLEKDKVSVKKSYIAIGDGKDTFFNSYEKEFGTTIDMKRLSDCIVIMEDSFLEEYFKKYKDKYDDETNLLSNFNEFIGLDFYHTVYGFYIAFGSIFQITKTEFKGIMSHDENE